MKKQKEPSLSWQKPHCYDCFTEMGFISKPGMHTAQRTTCSECGKYKSCKPLRHWHKPKTVK